MAKFTQIQNPVKVVAKSANIDYLWGPYSTIQEALNSLGTNGADMVLAGRHFGIKNADGSVTEYKFTKDNDINSYVEIGVGGGDLDVDSLEVEGSVSQGTSYMDLTISVGTTEQKKDTVIQLPTANNKDKVGLMSPQDKSAIEKSISAIGANPIEGTGVEIKVGTNGGQQGTAFTIPVASGTGMGLMSMEDKAKLNRLDNAISTDAPSDGKTYARKNGNWTEVTENTYTAQAKDYADRAEGSSVAAQEAEDNAKYWSSDARESMDYAKQAKTDIVNIINNLDDETKSETDIRQDAEIELLKKQVGTTEGLNILQTDQADLAFGDKNGKAIVSFTDHIRTKSFDSRNAATKTYVQNYVATHGTGGITQEQMNAIVQMVLQQIGGNSGGAIEDNLELGRASVKNRADQWRLVQWTAHSDLQSALGNTISSIGTKTGLLYTSCMNVDKFVGFDVSLLTYMTAANNPYSMFYTENLKKKTSGYGFSYDYKNVRGTMGAYMGIVCNIFALNAVGCEIPWDTGSWDYCVQMGIMSLPADQTASGVEVGDLIWEEGHGRVVTAITGSGTDKTIEIQESIQDFPVINEPNKNSDRTALTVSDFNTFMQKHKLYRYNGLGKNRYKASPFIALNGETPQTYNYNNDICTFAGDYASFRQGQKIFLNYDLKSDGGWTHIELYKDGNLYGTYEKDTQHTIDLTSLNLTYGKYKARMKNGATYSEYTYFEILQANMAVSNSGDTYTMTFDSINARPLYLRICKDNGGPYATYALTNTDIEQGKLVTNVRSLINSQYGNIDANNVYAKITFVGEYGRVTNVPIKLNY